jgi:nitrogen fixation-related uncharacterized protein
LGCWRGKAFLPMSVVVPQEGPGGLVPMSVMDEMLLLVIALAVAAVVLVAVMLALYAWALRRRQQLDEEERERVLSEDPPTGRYDP